MNKEEQPTCNTDAFGNTVWELNDRYHRIDGPAVEYKNGDGSWYLNGERHRMDGPSVDWPNYCHNPQLEWYIHDRRVRLTQLELSVGNKKRYIFSSHNYKGTQCTTILL